MTVSFSLCILALMALVPAIVLDRMLPKDADTRVGLAIGVLVATALSCGVAALVSLVFTILVR